MNLVLIGMPGSGKSTVGKLLSRLLGLPLLDTDDMVERTAGRTIPEIFAEQGEEAFRDLESEAAETAAREGPAVISTGGGMIKRQKNMEVLRRGGIIFFLDRPPEKIAGDDHEGRPLIGADRQRVFQLYAERIGLYRAYADAVISDPATPEEAADEIFAQFQRVENMDSLDQLRKDATQ